MAGGPVPAPELAAPTAATLGRVRGAMAVHGSGRSPPNFGDDAAAIYPPTVLARLRGSSAAGTDIR
ncbi:hypothetical protein [Pseudonocardia asaccharolytica]|uniref:hypothetical protein n=1 Tax=Pseudonocardia asaccharolytica TaxID=54010 RepID=UPI000421D7F8|nr:hypothetical protein [Pseudonocardia asaccharolytica]